MQTTKDQIKTKTNQKLFVGIDVGAIAVKASIASAAETKAFDSRRTHGKPIETAIEILDDIKSKYGSDSIGRVTVTGSGGKAVAAKIGAENINEFQAITLAARYLYPRAKTVFEIGGQTSKYILVDETGITDYGINGDCAAGTGSFLDQQAARLHYNIEDVGNVTKDAEKSARIAGRCSVFAKSDMIHAQQMGYQPSEVLKGLCQAVARNFKAAIIKGRKIKKPVLFIGGVARNSGMVGALKEIFKFADEEIIVPENPEFFGALGAALRAKAEPESSRTDSEIENVVSAEDFSPPTLLTKDVVFLRDRVENVPANEGNATDVYLGLDVGSVSTNLVLINKDGKLLYDIYTMTRARPIEVVSECLKEVENKFGNSIKIKGVGTTGSGRELIGELIGADTIRDEITAHKTGAVHISKTMTDGTVDTIFEIGGQDSKFISIENGVVIDFTMNEACAAGTGSFLEEQAEKLGIKIKNEFAELALSSKKPLKLGERCTVFMERDVNAYQLRGADKADITAGLAYSVVLNYLNRVVRGRKIGNSVFFQGGTAYNDAVAAAFAMVLGKKIIVPPHNGVMGAIGAALLAKDVAETGKTETKFKGFDIEKISYSIREFTCKACTNECDVQEFTVDGSKTYWGDKCSSRYRKKAKTEAKPVLSDLVAERNKLLLENYKEKPGHKNLRIGIPRAMYFYDRFPFWKTYLEGIGFDVVVSDETNNKIVKSGITSRASEPCHPIGVAHGHIQNLLDKCVDYIWLPNILTAEPNGQDHVRPYLCPWGMTLPFMAMSAPAFEPHKKKFITPTLHHMHGPDFLSKQLYEMAKEFSVRKRDHLAAFSAALRAQEKFNERRGTLGEMALHKLHETGSEAVVLVGRPYNLFDLHINLNVPTKIRGTYGVDVIPMDLLPVPQVDITDIADQMFWNYGKKIISVAKFIGEHKNLHMIYITNFKCGPDSFIKHFSKEAIAKPFLTLQFDEHSNDAGIMTRIEAYLDSKGLLKKTKQKAAEKCCGGKKAPKSKTAKPIHANR